MGCDIHSYVEERHDGEWRISPQVYESDYRLYGSGVFLDDEYKACCSPVKDRNYDLFGFLAGIRSNSPRCLMLIGEQSWVVRGVPDDASSEVLKERQERGVDGHSDSWLTLRELVIGFTAASLQGYASGYREQLQFGLKQMKARAKAAGLSYDDMRLVFWFDN